MTECTWRLMKHDNPDTESFLDRHLCNPKHHPTGPMEKEDIFAKIENGEIFGIVEASFETPEHLKEKYSIFPPFFKTHAVGRDDIGEHMKSFAEKEDLLKLPRKCLILSYFIEKKLFITPLFNYYRKEMGLTCTKIYEVFTYEGEKCFESFVQQIVEARRSGDISADKALIAEQAKILANSAIGRIQMSSAKHKDVSFCNTTQASRHINNARFDRINALTSDVYEVSMNKRFIRHNEPLHLSLFVYQYANYI